MSPAGNWSVDSIFDEASLLAATERSHWILPWSFALYEEIAVRGGETGKLPCRIPPGRAHRGFEAERGGAAKPRRIPVELRTESMEGGVSELQNRGDLADRTVPDRLSVFRGADSRGGGRTAVHSLGGRVPTERNRG